MSIFFEIIIRSLIAFTLIMIIARILGKHTITQLTYNDFVLSITLGAITGNIAFNTAIKSQYLIVALVAFSLAAYTVAKISLKSRTMRKLLSGRPTILIENGKVLEENLRKLTLSMDTLNQELREKNIFDIEEVEFAVLELNGKLSVLKKPDYRHITRKDLAILSVDKNSFPIELIMDGQIITNNIHQDGLSPKWLDEQLSKRGLSLSQVFYAVKGTNGNLHFDLYEDRIKHPIKME